MLSASVPTAPRAIVTAGPAAVAAVVWPALGVLVVWPLGSVVVTGTSALGRLGPEVAAILARTVLAAAMATAIALALGLAAAYTVTRTSVPGRAFAGRVLMLPIAWPAFLPALALAWLVASPGGARAPLSGLAGIVIAQVLAFLPYAYVVLGNALAAVHPDLEDVAESLGAGRAHILRRVTLALTRPAMGATAAGIGAMCVADVGAPLLIGGDYRVLATALYDRATGTGDAAGAAALGLLMLPACLVLAAVASARLAPAVMLGVPAPGRPRRRTPAAVAAPLAVVTAASTLAVLAVPAVIAVAALLEVSRGSFVAGSLRSLASSIAVAGAAALAGTLLAFAVAGTAGAGRPPAARLVERLALLPAAVPGIVLGLGYRLAFEPAGSGAAAAPWIAVGALVAWRLPAAVVAALAALRSMDASLAEAGVSLGVPRLRALRRLVLPPMLPSIASVFAYLFVTALVAFGIVVLLVSPGLVLAPVAALLDAGAGRPGAACALAAGLCIVAGAAVALRRLLPRPAGAAVWFF